MKSVKEWKELLESINFPNFNKLNNDEMIGFIFTNCQQRDALLTWIVIQLGADFETNRILKHEAVAEYFKQRRVIAGSKVEDFINAKLSNEDQEVQWDKIFNCIKMQKRLIPQPYEQIPDKVTIQPEDTVFNENLSDFSLGNNLEPLYKELEILKKLRRLKPSDIEAALLSSGDYQSEQTNENKDTDDLEINPVENNQERITEADVKKSKSFVSQGDVKSVDKMLPMEETMSGTWYCTPDGLQKVFVPVGAPPLGELDFDLKKIKIVRENDDDKRTPGTEKDVKLAEEIEALYNKVKKRYRKTFNDS